MTPSAEGARQLENEVAETAQGCLETSSWLGIDWLVQFGWHGQSWFQHQTGMQFYSCVSCNVSSIGWPGTQTERKRILRLGTS